MSWQDYLALAFFAAAAVVIAARAYRALFGRAKAGCGSGCGSCGSDQTGKQPTTLLTIGKPPGR
jgi:hypothetical protein